MNVVLFDDPQIKRQLLPLTYTRPVAALALGMGPIAAKWEYFLGKKPSFLTEPYLQTKYPAVFTSDDLMINGACCPDPALVKQLNKLSPGESIRKDGILVGVRTTGKISIDQLMSRFEGHPYDAPITILQRPWDLFKFNGKQIRYDVSLFTQGRSSEKVMDEHTIIYAPDHVFIEPEVSLKAAIINAESGPVYLGKGSSIEEGAVVRGPFVLGEGSTVNAQARMRGDITIGPRCKVGGEVSNSIIIGHSNKGHDGFLGNSVIGEWCNIGADTNISNLKNNYDKVKIWDYGKESFIDSGEQFCGLFMGDHSKCGINTMFNTGTSVGVACNIFGAGFPRTFIPSFSWGGAGGFSTFRMDKVKSMARTSMQRRDGLFSLEEEQILEAVFEQTRHFRTPEKEVSQ